MTAVRDDVGTDWLTAVGVSGGGRDADDEQKRCKTANRENPHDRTPWKPSDVDRSVRFAKSRERALPLTIFSRICGFNNYKVKIAKIVVCRCRAQRHPTRTHALEPTSPAIDAGNDAVGGSFDQRGTGFPRVVSLAADIGAFEFDSSSDAIFADGFA